MKLLILGGNGMAGHILVDYFRRQGVHSVFYTTRDVTDPKGLILDVNDSFMVDRLVEAVHPDVIINAVGVLNSFADKDKIAAYHINGFLPHRLRRIADSLGARLIHISTDCVFSGDRGAYREHDVTDGTSSYAITKALGEVMDEGHLTIRTSIIGPEIRQGGIGLMQWFMSSKGQVGGYTRVFWNGVTTLELAKWVDHYLDSPVSGLIHLAHPAPVSKHDLLVLFQQVWNKQDVTIVPDDSVVQDRTLVSTREDVKTDLPDYSTMLKELALWMEQS
ncbi:dTDP-4-dehydrorhamnose reductase family protein [Paenibacillus silvae]|uniref:dTDP-4-dehydrorhamnose reductase family protein n=1 Tax=Paenibacillus silvae TaxID=1325358 RepID=UPI0020060FB5|nr:SDR family oxidoreductase [Paenibacillus silvae]MCK6076162.1 SDR family oxidoreductase [Paenibacillus silvae]MCK6150679.1 SDR family oxidoreductase [Paenibacillus silvae]MCK6268938.1 SDR family oxidoreductase [Paenibacillus silvae]